MHSAFVILTKASDLNEARRNAVTMMEKFGIDEDEMNSFIEQYLEDEQTEDMSELEIDGLRDEGYQCFYDNRKYPTLWDWYVLGGRWSGQFTQDNLQLKYLKQLNKFHDEYNGRRLGWTSLENSRDKQTARTLKLFYECIPNYDKEYNYPPPVGRDAYKQDGYTDDCVPAIYAWPTLFCCGGYDINIIDWFESITKGEKPEKMCQRDEYYEGVSGNDHIYNMESNSNLIPDNLNGWYAVMFDYHM